jgi:hypothetical protein
MGIQTGATATIKTVTEERCFLCSLGREKHIHTPKIHAVSGIRTHHHSVRASEDSSCLRPLGYRDRPVSDQQIQLPIQTLSIVTHTRDKISTYIRRPCCRRIINISMYATHGEKRNAFTNLVTEPKGRREHVRIILMSMRNSWASCCGVFSLSLLVVSWNLDVRNSDIHCLELADGSDSSEILQSANSSFQMS